MIAVDTNILVYAHRRDAVLHATAREVVRGCAEGRARWAIPWPCVHEFLAIVSHPRVFRPPTPVPAALAQVRAWMASPTLVMLGEGEDYFEGLASLLTASAVVGPRVHDARIAALCLQHGVAELWTADRDFNRFSSLTTRNPLA